MTHRAFIIIAIICLVTGCQTNSAMSPWERPSYKRAVNADPSPLKRIIRDDIDLNQNYEEGPNKNIAANYIRTHTAKNSVEEKENETGHMDSEAKFAFFDTLNKKKKADTQTEQAPPVTAPQGEAQWPVIERESNLPARPSGTERPSAGGIMPSDEPSYNSQTYQQDEPAAYQYDTAPAATPYQQNPQKQIAPVLQKQQMVRVAILLPLSGPQEQLGKGMLNAAQMALFDTADKNFELVPRDTKGTAEGAVIAAQEAIEAGASLIIGPLFGHAVKAVQPVIRRYDINMIAFSTDWSLAGNQTYIMGFLPFVQVQRVAEFASANGYTDIGILAPNSDYGNAVIAAYNSLAYRLGLNTATVARFPIDQSDVTLTIRSFAMYDERHTELDELKVPLETLLSDFPDDPYIKRELEQLSTEESLDRLPFDAVLLPVGGEQAISIANLLSYYDLDPDDIKRLGTGLWDDRGLAAESAMEGAWFAAPPPELRESFVDKYKSLHKETPPRIATLAYDATALASILASHGMRHNGSPSYAKRDLTNPNGFAGLDGIFRFRPDGLIERGLAVLEFKDQKMNVIDPAPTSFLQDNIGIQ